MAMSSDVNTKTTDRRIHAIHEVFTGEAGASAAEVNLHTRVVCEKNPGHKEFIRFPDFSIEHMPESLRQKDLYEFVKLTGDLTVCLEVMCTSEKRPDFYSDGLKPYPLGNSKGSKQMHCGTGRIFRISVDDRQTNQAESCKYCSKNLEPNEPHVTGTIFVNTATHVVFNNDEAKETKCYFFFDQSLPIGLIDHIKCARVIKNGLKSDLCKLVCEKTCDENLLYTLNDKFRRWRGLRTRLLEKYTTMDKSGRFAFIVSHLHGCSKMVTVGSWTHRIKVDEDPDNAHTELSQFVYTTPTCPGSSGACVMLLGCSSGMFDHVHGGVQESGGNYSGVGRDYLVTAERQQKHWEPSESINPSYISDPFAYFKT